MSNSTYYYYDKNDKTKGDWFNLNNWWINPEHTINTQSLPDQYSSVHVLPGSVINKASTQVIVDQIMVDNAILDIDIVCNDIFFINNATFKDPANHTIIDGVRQIPVIYSRNSVIFINGSKNYGCVYARIKVAFYGDTESQIIAPSNTVGAYEKECSGAPIVHSPLGRLDALKGSPPAPVPVSLTALAKNTISYNEFVSGGARAGCIMGPAAISFNDACYNGGLITHYDNKSYDFLEALKDKYGDSGLQLVLALYKKIKSMGQPASRGKPSVIFNGYSSNSGFISYVATCRFILGSFNEGTIFNGFGQINTFLNGNSAIFSSVGGNKGEVTDGPFDKNSSTIFINSTNSGSVEIGGAINFISSTNHGSLSGKFVTVKGGSLPSSSIISNASMINLISVINNGILKAYTIGCVGSIIGPDSIIDCNCGPGIILDQNSSMDVTLFENPYWYYANGGTVFLGVYYNGLMPRNGDGRIKLDTTHIRTEYPNADRIKIQACCPMGFAQDLRPTSGTFGQCIPECELTGLCEEE